MEPKEIEILVEKYVQGLCTDEEARIVEDTYDLYSLRNVQKSSDETLATVRNTTWAQIEARTKISRFNSRWYAAVAALLLMALGFSFYFFLSKDSAGIQPKYASDVNPGGNRAYITLSNGQRVDLDSTQSSLMSQDGNYAYGDGTQVLSAKDVEFATVYTPRAGHYVIILPDRTKVWLNADSYMKYPARFAQHERRIEIKGEAFLEVSKDANRPFIVESDQQEIKVLGTSFNMDNYGDQNKIVTTLVEGKLQVTDRRNQSSTILNPGQQALLVEGAAIRVQQVDTKLYTSWKDGVYFMKDQSLAKFAKQLERWYDVEIDMGGLDATTLSAIIHRDTKLSEVLDAITAKTGIRFKIEGRRVVTIDK